MIHGERYADALAASEAWIEQTGAMPIHAYDQDEAGLFWDKAPLVLISMNRFLPSTLF